MEYVEAPSMQELRVPMQDLQSLAKGAVLHSYVQYSTKVFGALSPPLAFLRYLLTKCTYQRQTFSASHASTSHLL